MNKEYRLKKNHEIASVVEKKQRVSSESYVIYYEKISGDLKVAISASKKLGNAVVRNYIKRVVREIIRVNISKISSYKMVIVVKDTFKSKSHSQRKQELEFLLMKIQRKENLPNENLQ